MKRLLVALLVATALPLPAQAQDPAAFETMSTAQIEAEAASLHPAALYVLASRLLAEGKGQQAANWMYAGQLRYRFMIAAKGEAARDDRILFSALTEQVGRPVNEYIAGDPDEWIAAMRWALEWDAATDNAVTSKTEFAVQLAEIRAGLADLIAKVDSSRDEIREQRAANGLENR
mgnify:FL=1|jgi:hypothetical protein